MSSKFEPGKYRIQRLSDQNLADVERLYTAVYGKILLNGFFQKKYDTTFTGVNHIGFIAYNEQHSPIAFYAVITCYIWLDGKKVLAAQSADTMTHPEFRNQGLFVELATQTFALCRTAGIRLLFGFPNQNSLPGFINKLGWQMTEHMDLFIIPVGDLSWQMIFRKLTPFKRPYDSYVKSKMKTWQATQQVISNPVFSDGFGGVYRDEAYIAYKTYTNTYVINAGDAVLWVKISNVLLIGDVLSKPTDFDGMLTKIKKLARSLGMRQVHFHTSPGTTLHGLFAERFSAIPSFPVIFKALNDNLKIGDIKFTSADIDTF